MNDIKPGWQSTEFIVSMLSLAVTVLVIVFHVPKEQAQGLSDAIMAAVPVVAAVLTQGLILWRYITGRQELKRLAMMGRMPAGGIRS